jgi:hypothetical protein
LTLQKKITDQLRDIADLRVRYPVVGGTAAVRQKNGLLLLKAIAKLHGGMCLSESFTNVLGVRYHLRCARGHEWKTGLRILFKGHWCTACAQQSRRLTIEDMRVLAKERDGQCLSTEYTNSHTCLQWQCATGHQWWATPTNIGKGNWCPACRGRMPAEEHLALLARLAQERGGRLLSTVYHNSHEPLEWQCADGHIWMASSASVKNQNSWCRKCVSRYPKKENLARYHQVAKERGGQLLTRQFVGPRDMLTWRCESDHTWQAEPDKVMMGIWCSTCSGRSSDEELQAILSKQAVERGGRLVSERYLGPRDKLIWECHNGHRWHATSTAVKANGRWCLRCRNADVNGPLLMQKYHAVAAERGGQCLSTEYMTGHQKMQWRCSVGHVWSASPSNILSGKWCPKCLGRMPAEEQLALFAKVAQERGGKLLSSIYQGSQSPLLWSCAQGHTWDAIPASVKIGRWCPKCQGKFSKEEAHAIYSQLARDRGGELLSEKFLTNKHRLTWLCHRGHSWQASPSNVKVGTWCPQCAIVDRSRSKATGKYLSPSDKLDDFVQR